MKKTLLCIAIASLVLLAPACQRGLTQYVNPLVGTDFHGHTFPGAIVPFGQIQPSPDTRLEGWDGCSAYHYSDDTVYGFSHTHLSGTGCEDYGDILLMPVAAENGKDWQFSPLLPQSEFCSPFSHRSEKAEPGYYRLVLRNSRIMVELTADRRVACHRYTFPNQGKKGFVIDLRHRDKVISAGFEKKHGGRITGWRESNAWNPDQKCFFALECSEKILDVRLFDDGRKALVLLPDNCKEAEVYVSISGVDCRGAEGNLNTRQGRAFDQLRSEARDTWERTLAKIEVEGGSRAERQNFYTALYHCYTSPYLWSDADGRFRGMDDSIYRLADSSSRYTVFSLWDTYRALHPLMAILEPQVTEDWIATMLSQFESGGELTMWELSAHETHCMIGYHACPVILEAYNCHLLDSWTPQQRLRLLQAMVATSNRSEAHQAYARQGYMDSRADNESVSKTLEYSYDDWCIAAFARKIGSDDPAASAYCDSVARAYTVRCQSWQNLMDENGFMHARRNGGFVTPFDPTEVNNHYTEANSWQYSTYVPHDIYAWIALQGGAKKAAAFLDNLFTSDSKTTGRNQSDITGMIGQYAHGNEPSHHAAYLYNYLGLGSRGEKIISTILRELYTPGPDGLCGNEDCGQMSAWFVMSAMGFYPVCPGSGEYAATTPLFDRITIHRDGRRPDLVIDKSQWQPGQFWDGNEFYTQSRCGLRPEERVTPAPYFNDWNPRFEGVKEVRLRVKDSPFSPNARIFYTLDGSAPDTTSTAYTTPIAIDHSVTIKAVAYSPRTGYSPVVEQQLAQFVADKRLTYRTKPAPQYAENGEEGLIDHLYGTTNYSIGGWQGWTGDMEVVIDLLEEKPVTAVGVDCLENMRSWVFFPARIEVSISADGSQYRAWGRLEDIQKEFPATLGRQEEKVQHTFLCSGSAATARYVKIKAVNFGKMPDWHVSAGEQAWIFIDEITIN